MQRNGSRLPKGQPDWARPSLGAWIRLRAYDDTGRDWAYLALLDSECQDGHKHRGLCGAGRARHYFLGAAQIHGHAFGLGGLASRAWRRPGVSGRSTDWKFLSNQRS